MGAPAVPRGAAAAQPPSRRVRSGRATARRLNRDGARDRSAASSLAAASLAACAIGLTGVDGGLLWIVAGVFTLRSSAGVAPGIGWGIALLGAGLRWGTFGLGDLGSATRLLGPTVAAGSAVVRVSMIAVLAGAVLDESRRAHAFGDSWLAGAASLVAFVSLVPSFIVAGPDELSSVLSWAAAAAGVVVAAIVVRPLTRRLPGWVPLLIVVSGVVAAEVAL
jgi:hypothetical protein